MIGLTPLLVIRLLAGLTAIVALTLVACGATAPVSDEYTGESSVLDRSVDSSDLELSGPFLDGQPVSGLEDENAVARAVAAARATPLPLSASSASDEVIFVTSEEPRSLSAWDEGCVESVSNSVCAQIASDPLTWFDSATFEVVPLAGVESWSQLSPDRWRFILRQGVTFHNDETWNAEAARLGMNYLGNKATSGHGMYSFGLHGAVSGEVVDDLTIDINCQIPCPIFPRTAIYATFQAPEWWKEATQEERASTTVGLGPYRIANYVPGTEVRLEAFENYKSDDEGDARFPDVEKARQVWQLDPLARAAMVGTAEAHWAEDIGFQNTWAVPVAVPGTNNEVFTLVADNIWHPELSKRGVREALTLAIDCDALVDFLYEDLQNCVGNIAPWGTAGINENNFQPFGYDPERARELLAQNEYDPENVIRIHTRLDPVYRSLALLESVATMWEDVGVNAEIVVLDPASARDHRISGCGQFGGPEGQLQCAENAPPPPIEASTHYFETVASNEVMDLQRHLLLRTNCHSINSRVCNLVPGLEGMTFQESISDAIGTPMGT